MEKKRALVNTPYDIVYIEKCRKRMLFYTLLKLSVGFLLAILSISIVILFSSCWYVFVCGCLTLAFSVFFFVRELKKVDFSSYKYAFGDIADVHKEIKIVSTTAVGGYGAFVTRKYDTYKKNQIRLAIFINDSGKIQGFYLNGVNEKQVKYYEESAKALHIWGTRFPVKPKMESEEWLCPVCGAFNKIFDKTCIDCKLKILK